MKNIILYTNKPSLLKHWERALEDSYKIIHIDNHKILKEYLGINTTKINIMIDELSTNNIEKFLDELTCFSHLNIALFHSLPDVHNAITLIGKNVKGYENSYINQLNLLKMLETIEDGKNWFFVDLTNYIVNKFLQESSQDEPDFLEKLTHKEKVIALLIADGLTNKEIVQKENISLSTVKGHIQKIFEKAGVSDRVSLALMFK